MPLRALTGFEFGTTAGLAVGNVGNKVFDVVDGAVAINSGSARTGTYFYHHDTTAATQGCKWTTDTLGTGQTFLLWTLAIRFPSALPGVDSPCWAMHCAGPDMAGWYITARDGRTNAFAVSFDDITYFYADGITVAPDVWYTIEARWDVSGATTVIDWRVTPDGAATVVAQQASAANGPSTIAECEVGYINNARTFVADYDDLAAWTDTTTIAFPGKQKVVALLVDPAGTVTLSGTTGNFNTFTSNGTLAAWNATTARNNIDEIPPTIGASADGFVQINLAASDYVEIPMTSYTLAAGETVTGARMLAPGWATSTTAATIGFRSWNGTTETALFAAADPNFDNSTTTPAWVCKMLTTADIDTQSELDALAFRVGFSGDATPDIGIHAILAELAVTQSAPASAPPPSRLRRMQHLLVR